MAEDTFYPGVGGGHQETYQLVHSAALRNTGVRSDMLATGASPELAARPGRRRGRRRNAAALLLRLKLFGCFKMQNVIKIVWCAGLDVCGEMDVASFHKNT